MILVFLLAVTATFRPAAPTVGDPIAIDFPAPVVLDASTEYEVVSRQGNRVVVRTFEPQPFALGGTMGSTRFRNLVVPVHSVLAPQDSLKPAPLKPPQAPEPPRLPYVLIGAAALTAAGVWAAVVWLAKRDARIVPVVPALPPREQFRVTVDALLRDPRAAKRWAALADATRAYLAATTPHLGAELTTHELLTRAGEQRAILTDVLRQGDLEKFSPWGAAPLDFEAIALRAVDELAPEPVVEVAA